KASPYLLNCVRVQKLRIYQHQGMEKEFFGLLSDLIRDTGLEMTNKMRVYDMLLDYEQKHGFDARIEGLQKSVEANPAEAMRIYRSYGFQIPDSMFRKSVLQYVRGRLNYRRAKDDRGIPAARDFAASSGGDAPAKKEDDKSSSFIFDYDSGTNW